MKNNDIERCTHPVPSNEIGVIAMHCVDNIPLSHQEVQKLFDGPMAVVGTDVEAEITRSELVDKL